MPTKLNRGVIELFADYTVCKEGQHISPGGAILLRLFGHELATFNMSLLCCWVGPHHCLVTGRFRFITCVKCPYGFAGKASALRAGKRASGGTPIQSCGQSVSARRGKRCTEIGLLDY
jgi:hypothetical protein